jgi:ADP-heptose:LPS heptosyltransferase
LQLSAIKAFDQAGVSLFSLQFGAGATQASGENSPVHLLDLTAESDDFADTAALIEQLDLVVTADTVIAHVAASLGKPTWLLLYAVPDWRWMLERDDSPWYPTVRIFRQTKRGDWEHPVTAAADAMAELARAHAAG